MRAFIVLVSSSTIFNKCDFAPHFRDNQKNIDLHKNLQRIFEKSENDNKQ